MQGLTLRYLSTQTKVNILQSSALIIVAHGSRRDASNEEVMQLGEKVKPLVHAKYEVVKTAFLEFATPSLERSITECAKEGMTDIVILPYFLASGNHVTLDIPAVIAQMNMLYPDVKITLKAHVGSSHDMSVLLSRLA